VRAAVKLILGETRLLPAGVAALLALALVGEALAGAWWREAGGFVILGGAIALLVVATATPR
jgi:hypothetical protein